MGFVNAFVLGFVHLLGFVGKFSYFKMIEIVAVSVAEGNMEAVFHFAFELVDKNALTLDFVVVLVENIVC